jgi:hypothetical protein
MAFSMVHGTFSILDLIGVASRQQSSKKRPKRLAQARRVFVFLATLTTWSPSL